MTRTDRAGTENRPCAKKRVFHLGRPSLSRTAIGRLDLSESGTNSDSMAVDSAEDAQ